jgi:hypothetical protein
MGASSEEILKVIDRCPSGALSYKMVKAGEFEMTSAQIKVMKNGPLLVGGNCAIIDRTGKEAASNKHFALCRCGSSKNKPFAMERTSRSDSTIQNKRDKDPVLCLIGDYRRFSRHIS